MVYSYSDKQLMLGKTNIEFLSPIKDVLEVNGILLVLLQRVGITLDTQESMNSNIYAFNEEGEKLWEIQESPSGGKRDKPYTAVYVESDEIVAYCGLGFEYSLNLADGSVEPRGGRPW